MDPDDILPALYTEPELIILHRTFEHPSVKTVEVILRHADGPCTDVQTSKVFEKFKYKCKICKRASIGPRKFKLTVGTQEFRFNHRLQVNIGGRLTIHMVDEDTLFLFPHFFSVSQQKRFGKQFSRCVFSLLLAHLTTSWSTRELHTHQNK